MENKPKNEEPKKMGTVSAIMPKSIINDVISPQLHNVATKIKVVDPAFMPEHTSKCPYAELMAYTPTKNIIINSHGIVTIDCGIEIELPAGFKAKISCTDELAQKGIFIAQNEITNGRIHVILTNAGKEIVTIHHMQKIAQMSVEPVYLFKWFAGER